jgi:hypothetical protein
MIRSASVVIATYDRAGLLGEALGSVAASAQAWRVAHGGDVRVQVVVVDDASTDDTPEVVARFGADHTACSVVSVRQPKRGQSSALERAVPEIDGDIVGLLDSDGRFLPRKLQRVAEAFQADDRVGMVHHPVLVIDAQGRRTGEVRPKVARLSDGDVADDVRRRGRVVAPPTSGIALRAELFRGLHPTPLAGYGAPDAYLAFGAALAAPLARLDEPLAEYRQHTDSQFFRRISSIAGLEELEEIHRRIVGHFGLESTLARNSYFARNTFALERMRSPARVWVPAVARLDRALVTDPALPARAKVASVAFWDLVALCPRRVFWRSWLAFQDHQTGMRRARRGTPSTGAGRDEPGRGPR